MNCQGYMIEKQYGGLVRSTLGQISNNFFHSQPIFSLVTASSQRAINSAFSIQLSSALSSCFASVKSMQKIKMPKTNF